MTEETQTIRDVAISLQLPEDLVKKVDELARAEMRSRNKQFIYLLTDYFDGK